ncbi:MAG: PIN domain-containing protein [Dehalococcoidia bacterium]
MDTNAIIYHLNHTEPYVEMIEGLFSEIRDGTKQAVVSTVTELELLVRPMRLGDRWELRRVRMVLESQGLEIVELDRAVAHRAAEQRATTGLRLPDAIIVATAMYAGCDVIVGNDERCAKRVRDIPYVFLDELVKEQKP